MANDFNSNFTNPLMRVFLEKFENSRILSKNVNTQLFAGKFNGSTGDTVDVKRPTDYVATRTATGDLTGATAPIIAGQAHATVQDYISVMVDYDEAAEALEMDQLDELLAPAATRIVTDLETDFANFMMVNSGLLSGDIGTQVSTWGDIANMGATLESTGVAQDGMWNCAVNSFVNVSLADSQRSLAAADNRVRTANDKAVINDDFAGLRVITATTLASVTSSVGADRIGALDANPIVTYLGAKDTMQQNLVVTGFQANLVVKAGEVIQIAGRNRLNLSTRQQIVDGTGAAVVFTGTVVSDVTLDGSGEGTIVITGPAIFEAAGGYNTTATAAVSGDVLTLLGAASTLRQPSMFWHKNAFSIASIPIKKLAAQDTVGTTSDGLQLRVSRGSDIVTNTQIVRFDLRPAYSVLNPFMAGQGYGIA